MLSLSLPPEIGDASRSARVIIQSSHTVLVPAQIHALLVRSLMRRGRPAPEKQRHASRTASAARRKDERKNQRTHKNRDETESREKKNRESDTYAGKTPKNPRAEPRRPSEIPYVPHGSLYGYKTPTASPPATPTERPAGLLRRDAAVLAAPPKQSSLLSVHGGDMLSDAMLTIILICCAAAFTAGFVDSVAGGGGLIQTPIMLLAGVPPHNVLGTSKFSTTFGTGLAILNYARSGCIVRSAAGIGVVFSLLGAYAGSTLVLHVDADALGKVITALLPIGALALFLPARKTHDAHLDLSAGRFYLVMPLTAFTVGAYDGFFGPGAGTFFILALHWFLHMDLVHASGTAKVFNLASNMGALGVFLWDGKVLFTLGIPLALANMAGNYLGSRLAIQQGAGVVRKFLCFSLALLFCTLIWRYFFT